MAARGNTNPIMLSPAQPIRSGAARKRQEPPEGRRSSDEDVVPVGGVVGNNGAVGGGALGAIGGSWLAPSPVALQILRAGQRYCGLLEHNSYSTAPPTPHERRLVAAVNEGLRVGVAPTLSDDGTGGTYFLYDVAGRKIAVFKPSDEEPGTPNNPRGWASPSPGSRFLNSPLLSLSSPPVRNAGGIARNSSSVGGGGGGSGSGGGGGRGAGAASSAPRHGVVTGFAVSDELPSITSSTSSSSMPARPSPLAGAMRPLTSQPSHQLQSALDAPPQRSGIPCGSAACRELAAFLLDRGAFAGVPMTALAIVQHEAFHSADAAQLRDRKKAKVGSLQAFVTHLASTDEQPPRVLRRVAVDAVHRVAVLDIRLCNTDRHGGNLLLSRASVAAHATSIGGRTTSQHRHARRPSSGGHSDGARSSVSLDSSASSDDATTAILGQLDDLSHAPRRARARRDDALGDIDIDIDDNDDNTEHIEIDPATTTMTTMTTRMTTSGERGNLDDAGDDGDDDDDDDASWLSSECALHLVPIDHGYTLPSNLEEAWFEWYSWPQARAPFSASTLSYIESLNWRQDVDILRKFGDEFCNDTFVVLRLTTTLLQRGARRGCSAFDIASMLELIIARVRNSRFVERETQLRTSLKLSTSSMSSSSPMAVSPAHTPTLVDRNASSPNSVASTMGVDVNDEEFFVAVERLMNEAIDDLLAKRTENFNTSGGQFQFD